MASETVTLTAICAGGEHLTFTLTGARSATARTNLAEMTEAISDEDIMVFCRVIAKLARIGRTQNQARTFLQNGVTIPT